MTRGTFARFEPMEVRRLLSTVVVDTLNDETTANSTTSLREAIQLAAAGDAVQFKAGLNGQITLSKGELTLTKNLTIVGPGAGTVGVSGNQASRVFRVAENVTAGITGIKITDGKAETGAGIYADLGSKLMLKNVVLTGNNARGANGQNNDGGDGHGGAIYNQGTLDIVDSQFIANAATGGNGQFGVSFGNGGEGRGGAIYNEYPGALAALRTTFLNNSALGGLADGNAGGSGAQGGGDGGYAQGGAILSSGDSQFTGCTFESNVAFGSNGGSGEQVGGFGGAAFGGAIYTGGRLDIFSSVFSKNGAKGGNGGIGMGGLANGEGQPATAGAIFVSNGFTLRDSTLNGNYAVAAGSHAAIGGAIAAYGTKTDIYDSTIAGNTAKADQDASDIPSQEGGWALGGGIVVGGEHALISGSTISHNAAVGGAGGQGYELHGTDHPSAAGGGAQGGGVFVEHELKIFNSTIANNTVTGGAGGAADPTSQSSGGMGGNAQGAGIYTVAGAGTPITASTIAANEAFAGKGGAAGPVFPGVPQIPGGANGAANGGGVFGGGWVTFSDTIIAGNKAPTAGHDVVGAIASQGFNLIGTRTDSSGWKPTDLTGTNASPLNAKLAALANNGGKTKTMLPLSGSPAIDEGRSFQLLSDQRGLLRPFDVPAITNAIGGDGSDIGAVEVQSTPFSGTPAVIATKAAVVIQAEHFNLGAEGLAYHDVDTANLGGAFRSTGVDLQSVQNDAGGGYNVGWTKAGEWLAYTVDVNATLAYTFDFRVASNGAGGTFHLELDGKNVTGALTVPNTGGWQVWKTLTKSGVQLSAGRHVLRLVMDSVGANGSVGNFNYFKVAPTVAQQVTVNATAAAHVRDGSFAGANYGSSATLEVKKSTVNYNRQAFLKFDLSGVASIASAKLRLFGRLTDSVTSNVEIAAFGVANPSWNESTLTWNSRPATGAAALSKTVVTGTSAAWHEFNLTAYLAAEKAAGHNVVTIALRSNTSTSTLAQFNSDEAVSNRPQLVIMT